MMDPDLCCLLQCHIGCHWSFGAFLKVNLSSLLCFGHVVITCLFPLALSVCRLLIYAWKGRGRRFWLFDFWIGYVSIAARTAHFRRMTHPPRLFFYSIAAFWLRLHSLECIFLNPISMVLELENSAPKLNASSASKLLNW